MRNCRLFHIADHTMYRNNVLKPGVLSSILGSDALKPCVLSCMLGLEVLKPCVLSCIRLRTLIVVEGF